MLGCFLFVSVSFFFLQVVLVLPVEVSFVYMLSLKCSVLPMHPYGSNFLVFVTWVFQMVFLFLAGAKCMVRISPGS